MSNKPDELHLAFIGCGVMGESMVAGLLRREMVKPSNIIASHPRADRRVELKERYGIEITAQNAKAAGETAVHARSAVVLCVKPQRLAAVLADLAGTLHPDQLVISIVAGA